MAVHSEQCSSQRVVLTEVKDKGSKAKNDKCWSPAPVVYVRVNRLSFKVSVRYQKAAAELATVEQVHKGQRAGGMGQDLKRLFCSPLLSVSQKERQCSSSGSRLGLCSHYNVRGCTVTLLLPHSCQH